MDKDRRPSTMKVETSPGERRNSKRNEITTQISSTPFEDESRKDDMDIEGVLHITISIPTQRLIGFETDDINIEMPWMNVSKEIIEQDISRNGPLSDFYHIKEQIKAFPGSEIFIGYHSTAIEPNRFYVCVTNAAENAVINVLNKNKLKLEKHLENVIHKQSRLWISLGSEQEVDNFIIKSARPLIEKEAVTTIDRLHSEINFTDCNAKDNYVKFLGMKMTNVVCKRYECDIQASPSLQHNTAQTDPGLPTNAWTQYEYEIDTKPDVMGSQLSKAMGNFLSQNFHGIENRITYNEGIDLYKDDFPEEVVDEDDMQLPEEITYKLYESFIDVQHCKGKLISCVVWHPTLTNVVAISYVQNTRSNVHRTWNFEDDEPDIDEMMDAVYVKNYVLMWCLTDKFKPKLFLESPREVHSLKFCPFNENILIGGLLNGQVIVWDITGQLEHDEEKGLKSRNQIYYHRAMSAHLGWMKPIRSQIYVKPMILSHLKFSHNECITDIQWISPFWKITESGTFEVLKEYEKSEQFITCSEDGWVNIWDLRAHTSPSTEVVPSHRAPTKKPMLKPHFQFIAQRPEMVGVEDDADQIAITVPLSTIAKLDLPMSYTKKEVEVGKGNKKGIMNEHKTLKIHDKYVNVAVPMKPINDPISEIILGTVCGFVMKVTWADADSDTEKTNNEHTFSYFPWADVHDGPIVTLTQSPFVRGLYLTVGGKVFAIWKEDIKDVPIYCKRSPLTMTSASWSNYRPSVFHITYENGMLEVWDLFAQTDGPTFVQNISGKLLTGLYSHPLPLAENIIGIGDYNGSFHVYYVPHQHTKFEEGDVERLRNMIDHEVSRKEALKQWKKEWEIGFAEILKKKQEEAEIEAKRQEEADRERNRILKEERKRRQQELEARRLRKAKRLVFTWKRQAEEQWHKKQEEYMISTLLTKKKLNKEELQIAQQPYIKVMQEEKVKQIQQREKLTQRDTIYKNVVDSLLPEDPQKCQLGPIEHHMWLEQLGKMKATFVEQYKKVESDALQYIKAHSFELEFDFLSFIEEGKCHRRDLDPELWSKHVGM